jgi:hypothetical protein
LIVEKMEQHDNYIDDIFHFQGKWEMPSLCGLKILDKTDNPIIILTELYTENPGSSATDMIEVLAGLIVTKYNLDPEKSVFIVRNPERSAHYEFFAETFHRAIMNWNGERFTGLAWEKVDKIFF